MRQALSWTVYAEALDIYDRYMKILNVFLKELTHIFLKTMYDKFVIRCI